MTYARVPRWRVGAGAALSLVALAVLYASPLLLAASVVPLGYVVYGAVSAVPSDATLGVERTIHDSAPTPGERVRVTVTVENTGPATLPDVRVVDGVPAELAVSDGSPRRCVALRPGESETLSYEVLARRGEYPFDPAAVRIRSLAGAAVLTATVDVAGDQALSCLSPLTGDPSGTVAPLRAGTHPTDSGGPGLEFRSTREYRPGDPRHRIHWRRFAKTGELTTVSFREERAVRTVLIVDARPVARVSPRSGVPTGADLCGYAGERLYEALAGADVVTSVTALGVPTDDLAVPVVPGEFPWADGDGDRSTASARAVFDAVRDVADGTESPAGETGDGAQARSARGLDTVSESTVDRGAEAGSRSGAESDSRSGAGSVDASDEGDGTGETTSTPATDGGDERAQLLLAALPPEAEVVLLSPLVDGWPASLVRTLRTQDYPVTVFSPDVTATGTTGGRVAAVERRHRLAHVEATGATAVTWTPGTGFEVTLAEAVTHLLGGER